MRRHVVGLYLMLAGALVLLVGCSEERSAKKGEPANTTNQLVFDITPPQQHEISGAGTVRRVFGGTDGTTLVEKHTPYADGTRGHVYYRTTDGTVRLAREDYKDGQLKSTANYAEDGKTLVNGEVYRPDSTLYMTWERLPNGNNRVLFYALDGKYNVVSRESFADGVVEDTYLRKDKTVFAKVRGKMMNGYLQDEWIDIYRDHETSRLMRIELRGSDRLITHFNARAGAEYKQLWKSGYDSENMNNMLLAGLDELDWQGQVVRGLIFKEEKAVLTLQAALHRVSVGTYPHTTTEIHTKTYRTEEKNAEQKVVEEWKDERSWIPADKKKPLRRTLHIGTLKEVTGPAGVISKHEATENLREVVHLSKLRRPNLTGFEQQRSQVWREDRGFLGHRDDTDPCRWYHR